MKGPSLFFPKFVLLPIKSLSASIFTLTILMQQASVLSRELGLPRVYIAANSGARIGLAEELKHLYKVAWVDETTPNKGFRYLYLLPLEICERREGWEGRKEGRRGWEGKRGRMRGSVCGLGGGD